MTIFGTNQTRILLTPAPLPSIGVILQKIWKNLQGIPAFSPLRILTPPFPPPPHHFCKNYLYEGIDLETWNLACDTLVPSLAQEKYEIPPIPVIFAKSCKKILSKFLARRSQDKVPMHKIIIRIVYFFLNSILMKYEPPPPPSFPVIFAKTSKNFISRFSARRSRDKVPMHKIKIVEKVHIWLTCKNFSPIGWRV